MTEKIVELVVAPDGTATCIYFEDLDLANLGEVQIRRASHCEPDEYGCWWADLWPVVGPRLGPFTKRSDSVEAEVQWLRSYWLDGPHDFSSQ
jgi:hypothetical protein